MQTEMITVKDSHAGDKHFENARKLTAHLKKLTKLRGNAYLGTQRVWKFYTSFGEVLAQTPNSQGIPIKAGVVIKFDNFRDVEIA